MFYFSEDDRLAIESTKQLNILNRSSYAVNLLNNFTCVKHAGNSINIYD